MQVYVYCAVKYQAYELTYVQPKSSSFVTFAPQATLPIQYTLLTETIDQCQPSVLHYSGGCK